MDETLSELLENSKGRSLLGFDSPDVEIQLSDVTPGLVSFGDGDKRQEYMLKPLKELYGIGNGTEAVDPESDTFMPLFLAIEETIAGFDADTRRLTDAEVALRTWHAVAQPGSGECRSLDSGDPAFPPSDGQPEQLFAAGGPSSHSTNRPIRPTPYRERARPGLFGFH